MMISELVGPNNQYTEHIGNTTHTSVQLRGFGSGCTGEYSSEDPLHFVIGGDTEQQVVQGEALAQNLVATVRSKREQFYQSLRPPRYNCTVNPPQCHCCPDTPVRSWGRFSQALVRPPVRRDGNGSGATDAHPPALHVGFVCTLRVPRTQSILSFN